MEISRRAVEIIMEAVIFLFRLYLTNKLRFYYKLTHSQSNR